MASYRWACDFLKWSPTKEQIQKALMLLTFDEIERLQKFVFSDDYRASLIGKLMIKKLVRIRNPNWQRNVQIECSDHGKPFVSGCDYLFNVSHHGSFTVLVAESKRCYKSLGVDCMSLDYKGGKSVDEYFRLMNRNFSDAEWQQIKSDNLPIRTFFRIWSLKESYVKALGIGVTIDLRTISFELHSPLNKFSIINNSKLYRNGIVLNNWMFHEYLLDSDHCVAIALESVIENDNQSEKMFDFLAFDDLLIDEFDDTVDETRSKFCNLFFEKVTK